MVFWRFLTSAVGDAAIIHIQALFCQWQEASGSSILKSWGQISELGHQAPNRVIEADPLEWVWRVKPETVCVLDQSEFQSPDKLNSFDLVHDFNCC